MKRPYYTITISDLTSSRHFLFGKTAKRNFSIIFFSIAILLAVSLISNIYQYRNTRLLATYMNENVELLSMLETQKEQLRNISYIVTSIEEFTDVESADAEVSLGYRIEKIGEYYTNRELKYSEIGNRVEQIEGLIGLDDDAHSIADENDLLERVELATLTANQKRNLYDSLPSGYPIENQSVTSSYGRRKHPVTNILSFHKGIDLRSKTGSPIYAPSDGIVKQNAHDKLSGNKLVLAHNFGFETRYAHLKRIHVKPGDVVYKGDLIAETGNTGRSSGPHLHYEIHYLGKSVNPIHFLQWQFGTDDIFNTVREIKWASLINLINKQVNSQTLQLSRLEPAFTEN